jgi:hypothetical protein
MHLNLMYARLAVLALSAAVLFGCGGSSSRDTNDRRLMGLWKIGKNRDYGVFFGKDGNCAFIENGLADQGCKWSANNGTLWITTYDEEGNPFTSSTGYTMVGAPMQWTAIKLTPPIYELLEEGMLYEFRWKDAE